MGRMTVDTEKIIAVSQEIARIAENLQAVRENALRARLSGVLEALIRPGVDLSIFFQANVIAAEAAHMSSLGRALEEVARKYQEVESKLLNAENSDSAKAPRGTDKRGWFRKFWDWVTKREPDDYDTTTLEQEKAADAKMKEELWKVLQDEKYSRENWDRASVEERKQILQDYMDEVIRIYGLKHVKKTIRWDPNATYTDNSITWGYYNHGFFSHTVTLNERALSDSNGSWDSYDLLETVSHELRHAYQHEAVDHPTEYMVSKETIDSWSDNFDHYINADVDYGGYRAQPVEVDARDFQVNRDTRPGS